MAFYFDRAVWNFGATIEAQMDKITHKNEKIAESKRRNLLNSWLSEPGEIRGRFKDPASKR